ncbi:unnamed protein product [Clavelina lepadiformis]|uniref:Death domain-containing protein n=1 Tax=Clavelina lepadiformis TaxID=159417 RepID=A0ABP0FYG6_CLALP
METTVQAAAAASFLMPKSFERLLKDRISDAHCGDLEKTLEHCQSRTCEELARFCFKLTTSDLNDLEYDDRPRPYRIHSILLRWRENKKEEATYENVIKLLKEDKLFAIAQRWWITYSGKDNKFSTEKRIKELEEFILFATDPYNLSSATSEDQWNRLYENLKIEGLSTVIARAREKPKTTASLERLNILTVWLEQKGFEEATKAKLVQALNNVGIQLKDDNKNKASLFSMPPAMLERRKTPLDNQDLQFATAAIENCKSYSWQQFGVSCLKLSEHDVEAIIKEKENVSRANKFSKMLCKWKKSKGSPNLDDLADLLTEAKLEGIKHQWFFHYRSEMEKAKIEEQISEQHELYNRLINCRIAPNEWRTLLRHLNVQDKENDVYKANKHNVSKQRLDILHIWEEGIGYERATIDELKSALKNSRLRRVHCHLEENPICARFGHFLEDQWDHIFSELEDEQKQRILQKITRNSTPLADTNHVNRFIDEGFKSVYHNGNHGFFKFIKELFDEVTAHKKLSPSAAFIKLIGKSSYLKLFEMRCLWPVVSYFQETESYDQMKKILKNSHRVLLNGAPGCGKTQSACSYAKEFERAHPLSVIWFVHLKYQKSLSESLSTLHNRLSDAGVHVSPPSHEQPLVNDLVRDIKRCGLPFLLVLDNVDAYKEFELLSLLLQRLKNYNDFYLIGIQRSTSSHFNIPDAFLCYFPEQCHLRVKGFTDQEAKQFLQGDHTLPSKEEECVIHVAKEFHNLPLGLVPARHLCKVHSQGNYCSFKSLLQLNNECEELSEDETKYFEEKYGTQSAVCKPIMTIMKMGLKNLGQFSLLGCTVDLLEIFSYSSFYHHKEIPLYLFERLICLLANPEKSKRIVISKTVLDTLLFQLKHAGFCVINQDQENIYKGTISIHKVVRLALKSVMPKEYSSEWKRMLLNAMVALSCHFPKDNRNQEEKAKNYLPIIRHVSKILEVAEANHDSLPDEMHIFKTILMVRLQEVKGFAFTQCGKPKEACTPLQKAYDHIIKFVQRNGDLGSVEISSESSTIDKQAKAICNSCRMTLQRLREDTDVFVKLFGTVFPNLNEATVKVMMNKCSSAEEFHQLNLTSAFPFDRGLLSKLEEKCLVLRENLLKRVYLAELLASILYTRGRLMFYDGFDGDRETHIYYLKLAKAIAVEIQRSEGLNILHLLNTDTNALLYLCLDESTKSIDEKCNDYRHAYNEYKAKLSDTNLYYEQGILKEDGKTVLNHFRYYSQMFKASHKLLPLQQLREECRFQDCKDLLELVKKNPNCSKNYAIKSLISAAEYCKAGEKFDLAIEIHQKVQIILQPEMEDLSNQEILVDAAASFAKTILHASEHGKFIANISNLPVPEARDVCERVAQVPRADSQLSDELKTLAERLLDVWDRR